VKYSNLAPYKNVVKKQPRNSRRLGAFGEDVMRVLALPCWCLKWDEEAKAFVRLS
jgi:hypothetical protein